MKNLHPGAVWLFFFQFLAAGFVIVIFIGLFSFPLFFEIYETKRTIAFQWGWLILVILLYLIFCYIWAKLTYYFWRYELTEDAVKIEKGVIYKKYISIPYERIQNVDIYRGILARILGLSELHIQTAGYSSWGRYGGPATEGRLPGLPLKDAEELREELVKKIKGTKQGL